MTEPAANGPIRHGLRRAIFPEGEGFEVPHPSRFPLTPGCQMSKPHRLQRDLKRNNAAILQRVSSALAEIQRNPLQSSRPGCSRHYAYSGEQRGTGGELL